MVHTLAVKLRHNLPDGPGLLAAVNLYIQAITSV